MMKAIDVGKQEALVNGRWVPAKPIRGSLPSRTRDAIKVLRGQAEAVQFEQKR